MSEYCMPSGDPSSRGNSSEYYTGEQCITPGCIKPAGTVWSHLWCQEHNHERIARISRSMQEIESKQMIN